MRCHHPALSSADHSGGDDRGTGFGLAVLVIVITGRRWRHASRRGSPVTAVDPGPAVDRGCWETPDRPRNPDRPRKCEGNGGCACCSAESETDGTLDPGERETTA